MATATRRQRSHGTGSLFKRNGRGPWIASWYDHNGKRRERSTGTTDKATGMRILGKFVADSALRKSGVVDATADKYATAGRRPLAEHVRDWREALLAKGNTRKHTEYSVGCVTRALDGCGLTHLAEVSALAMQAYVRDVRESRSTRTAN